jgi:hypothetical protein
VLLVQGPDIQQMGFRSAHFSRVHQARRVWLEHNLVPRVAPENGRFCSAVSRSRPKHRFGKGMVFQPCRQALGIRALASEGSLAFTRSGIFGIAANDRAQFDFRNPSSYLCHSGAGRHYRFSAVFGRRGNLLENLSCLRCNREIEAGQKSVAMYMFAQTVGVRPRQKSSAQRICFCPQCSVSLALGPPPEGALNIAAWQMIRDLVSADPALNEAAWENLRGVVGLLPATGTDGGSRRTAGYFEF